MNGTGRNGRQLCFVCASTTGVGQWRHSLILSGVRGNRDVVSQDQPAVADGTMLLIQVPQDTFWYGTWTFSGWKRRIIRLECGV